MSAAHVRPGDRVGFVGVGRMGSAMLRCMLKAGYPATLCDRSQAATAPFLADFPDRVRVAARPGDAASQGDIVSVVVNTNEQLEQACLGEGGVIAGARDGGVVLVHSTVSHATLATLCQAGAKRGVHVLDAPVSGARGHLSVGELAVMVGGARTAFERAKPVMETYGSLVLHLGGSGAGLDAKLAINMFRYLCMAAGQEATRLAERVGIGDAMADLVAHTQSNRYVGDSARLRLMKDVPDAQRKKDAELAQKDLRAAIARGREVDVELPSAEVALGLMHRLWGTEPAPGPGPGGDRDALDKR